VVAEDANAGIVEELATRGLAVRDGFLSDARRVELVDCAQQRFRRGDFAAAQIGAAAHRQRREDVRGDSTCWLAEPLFGAERALLERFESLRLDLNRSEFLGLFDLEMHYAHYPAGTGYARHVDQPRGRGQRRISMVLYLNEEWRPGLGGELRVFGAEGCRDIEPVGGRLVCFVTEACEHAVLVTHRERLSLSGWFRTRL
jgi:SM-20-related protein